MYDCTYIYIYIYIYYILYILYILYYMYYIYQQDFSCWGIGDNPPTRQNLLVHPAPGTISSPTKG